MLVLTRKQGESIIIGDGIKLTIVSVGPGRVKIGIVAPPNVRVDREEIHARIQQEHAVDVLSAVSTDVLESLSAANTMVNSGAETGILHNRIADKLPSESAIASQTESGAPPSDNPMNKFRPPRKPR